MNEKYHDQITERISRIYHRRQSRESKGSDDDGTSSNYSTTSLRTPDSLYDGKSYFSLLFPQRSDSESTDGSNRDLTTVLFNSTINSVDGSEYDSKTFLKSAFDSQPTVSYLSVN